MSKGKQCRLTSGFLTGNWIDVIHFLRSVKLRKEKDNDEFSDGHIEFEAFKSLHLKNNLSTELCQKCKKIHKP